MMAGTGAISSGAPGTRAEARAVPAACWPARRAPVAERSAVAAKPHEEPMSALTPIPACSPWRSPSISPFWADIDSVVMIMTRASA